MKKTLKKARTRDEFFELTRDWYGVGLTFTGSFYKSTGDYCIVQDESWYSRLSSRDSELGQYNGLRPILDSTFGELYCGGVATHHYGQYRSSGYRSNKRLKKLYQSVLSPKYQEVVSNYS